MRRQRITGITVACAVCGTETLRPPWEVQSGLNRFCSRRCAALARQGGPTKRFWRHVAKAGDDECWLWTGTLNAYGYGKLNVNGRRTQAHRFSYELAHGPIPDGLFVLHNCPTGDTRNCVNPAHLWLGSQTDNMADMVMKGRHPRGASCYNAKLTDDQVRAIRRRYIPGVVSQTQLAAEYGVARSLIGLIVSGQIWQHLL
jgi:hypothetical protein